MKINLVKGLRICFLLNEPVVQGGNRGNSFCHTAFPIQGLQWEGTGWKVSVNAQNPAHSKHCAEERKWTLSEAQRYWSFGTGCPWLGRAPVILCLEYDLQIKHRDTMQYITPNVSVLGIKWFTIFYACWDWLSKLRFSRSHGSYQLYRLQRDQEKIQWLHKNIDIKQISKITQNFFYFWDSITV